MTVADLIARLQELPAHHKIIICGPDCCGGYNWTWKTEFEAINYPNKGIVTLVGEGDDCDSDGRKF